MMNNRGHLPAGQMQGGVPEMGSGSGGSRRGGRHQPYPNSHHYAHHSVGHHMYPPGYMNPYAVTAAPYYPPHYQNGGMAAMGAPAYLPYPPNPATYGRSPPAMQQPHYVPMVPPNPYSRAPQSPIVASPYHTPPPPVPIPMPPHTPSSTHSHIIPPPSSTPPTTLAAQEPPQQTSAEVKPDMLEQRPPPAAVAEASTDAALIQSVQSKTEAALFVPFTKPFRPPLPWFSDPSSKFPARAPRLKRRVPPVEAEPPGPPPPEPPVAEEEQEPKIEEEAKETKQTEPGTEQETEPEEQTANEAAGQANELSTEEPVSATQNTASQESNSEAPAQPESLSTHDQADDGLSTSPTTPSSTKPSKPATDSITVAPNNVKPATRSAIDLSDRPRPSKTAPPVPVVPALPALAKVARDAKAASSPSKTEGKLESKPETKPGTKPESKTETDTKSIASSRTLVGDDSKEASCKKEITAEQQTPQKPASESAPQNTASESAQPAQGAKSWANVLKGNHPPAAGKGTAANTAARAQTNGQTATAATAADSASSSAGAVTNTNGSAIAEALRAWSPGSAESLAFLEPRGLKNTGNMCYMNSVLQALIFCIPFYEFLDVASKSKVHNLKNDTLLDAMINFKSEFSVIDSAPSAEQLHRRVRSGNHDRFGDAFTPEFVYEAVKQLPRFSNMKRGQQQDAEEFLGFLLDTLQDECTTAMGAPATEAPDEEWLEVGKRQRAAVTRSSGQPNVPSPISAIFRGQFRTEVTKKAGGTSITNQSYMSLPLPVADPTTQNVVDAIRGLTHPESINDGNDKVTKHTLIDSLPPVLILHLKRFQFRDGQAFKIWKKIGYPLELEIPQEALSPAQRSNKKINQGAGSPKYRLTAVIYHHGKNANDGHYTVDVRRQDGQEWIRIDDTVITRIRSEDVAEAGSEDKTKTSRLDGRKEGSSTASNRFLGIDEDTGDQDGWTTAATKKSNTTNGTPVGQKSKQHKENARDTKVAYLLFYQRI